MPHEVESVYQGDFSAATETFEFDALLFDMDGTIIDSTAAVVQFWRRFAKEIGLDGDEILKTSHGRRTIDILRTVAPERANWEDISALEASLPRDYGDSAVEIAGSRAVLERLDAVNGRWAIVTSGTRGLVHGWLDALRLARPRALVAAEDVALGKPDPACYLLGAQRVLAGAKTAGTTGGAPARMLVVEDAPAGVAAGKAAGFPVLAVATTHNVQQLWAAGADWVVRDLRSLGVSSLDEKTGRIRVEVRDGLVRA